MFVSARVRVLVMFVGSACADPDATPLDDNSAAEDLRQQCMAPLACPAPSSPTKQTICGQLFDLETGERLIGTNTAACTTTTESGPCALAITAYDAASFAQGAATAAPLAHGGVEIDGCGRYRITDVEVSSVSLAVALAIDDAAGLGPDGTTVTAAVAARKSAGAATDQLDAWIVKPSTIMQWALSGGPTLDTGVFVPMFRAHMLGTPDTDPLEPQSGVTFTRGGIASPAYDYFAADAMERTTIDATAVATGVNGTALVSDASINHSVVYSGSGGLADPVNCSWEFHVGMSQPGIVFVQIFRPVNAVGAQCSL